MASPRDLRPQSLIISIFGAYGRSIGGWLSVSSLISLLNDVGVDDPAVRSALSRFKRRGILISEKHGAAAGYALSESTWRTFDVGDARVLQRRTPPPNAGWVLAAFSIPESKRDVRYRLRSRLAKVGFAQVVGGLWVAPKALEADALYVVEALGLQEHVDIFNAEHTAFRTTAGAVNQWWDLTAIASEYESFTKDFKSLCAAYDRAAKPPTPASAFADYTRALTAWRPLPYNDPGLPRDYLPKAWPGDQATELFYALHDQLAHLAQQHVVNVVEGFSGESANSKTS